MKKKILAISICVCICFALLAIPAFATSVPETTSAPNVFDTLLAGGSTYNCSVSGYNNIKGFLQLNSASTIDTAFHVTNGVATYSGTSYNFDSFFYTSGADIKYYSGDTQVYSSSTGYPSVTFILDSLDGVQAVNYLTVTEVGTSGLVPELADEVFSVGGGLISFVMSHWIVLLPVVAFLVILCIGAIRKLIKGV